MANMINKLITVLLILLFFILQVITLPNEDIVQTSKEFPGQIIYSGYLSTSTSQSKLHYVFVQAEKNFSSAPVVVWLNGGPQCSSLFNMMTSVGPYILPTNYKPGDSLIKNLYSWNQVASILYIDTPAIVGFSTDKNYSHIYTDQQSAVALHEAVRDFIFKKAPQLKNNQFYISGVSYGGVKGIRLAAQIIMHNVYMTDKINIKGAIIGNGVIHTSKVQESQIKFLLQKDFVDERIKDLYKQACQQDFNSPRCKYVKGQIFKSIQGLPQSNVFVVCKPRSTNFQKFLLQRRQLQENNVNNQNIVGQMPQCDDFSSTVTFWNSHVDQFHVKSSNKTWEICSSMAQYSYNMKGVIDQYKLIFFLMPSFKIWLYSGDWDFTVPLQHYFDSLQELEVKKVGDYKPWFLKQDLAGFYQVYDYNVTLATIKGAGHISVQNKPSYTYQMFYNFIKNRPINTPVF